MQAATASLLAVLGVLCLIGMIRENVYVRQGPT